MDTRFAEQVARARSARGRVVDFQSQQGPIARLAVALVCSLILIIIVLLAVLLIPVLIVAGLVVALIFAAKRRFAAIGRPNTSVAGFRTDGRANVRVIDRGD